jgi:hypothetical protein
MSLRLPVITDGNKICDIVTNSIFYIFQKGFFSASEEVVNVYLNFQSDKYFVFVKQTFLEILVEGVSHNADIILGHLQAFFLL